MAFTIPSKWEVIGIVFGLLFLTAGIGGSFAYIYSQGKEHGALEERTTYQNQTNDALEKAIKERDEAYEELQIIEDEINASPETDDGPLAPVLRRELDKRVRG